MFTPRDGEANLFGVILYTDAHANVKKVLRDQDCWDAFDDVSGPQWAVFAIRTKQGKHGFPSFPRGTVGYMVPIWKEPRENRELIEAFELSSTEGLPSLVAFSEGDDGTVYRTVQKLDDSSKDTAYSSIKEALAEVARAVSRVRPENLHDAEGVHTAVDYAVTNAKDWKAMKRYFSTWRVVKSLMP
ncbi:MAG TPA: hypothetical protein VF710_18825 [Longimicrobium sp.]